MRRILNTLALVAAVAAFALLPASFVVSQTVVPAGAVTVTHTISAVDTDPALYIKWTGTTAEPTIAVEADGNLTFTLGGSAYTGFECPVSGALGGVIDVSDAACNTLGEVVDIINADINNGADMNGGFIAVIAGGLRSDASDDSFLADAADDDVQTVNGEIVYWDTSTLDDVNVTLTDLNRGGRTWWGDRAAEKIHLPANPFADSENVLLYASENITNAGTIGNFSAYCVVEKYAFTGGSETVYTMYFEAGAATTVTGFINEFINAGGLRCQGGKVLVRIEASGADTTAAVVHAYGYRLPLRK